MTAAYIQPAHKYNGRRIEGLLIVALLAGMVCAASATKRIEVLHANLKSSAPAASQEELLLNARQTVRVTPHVFRGLIADWYWMRSLQYIGGKMLATKENIQLDNLRPLNLTLIVPLLETTTMLDPNFIPAYEYIATILPAVNPQAAIELTTRGTVNNPQSWRLRQHLGYIYWQEGEYKNAAAAYAAGAEIPGAPAWMRLLAGRMEADGGSRDTSREIYLRMYKESDDGEIRNLAFNRLLWLKSLDERDALRQVLESYKTARGTCPASWTPLASAVQRLGFQTDAGGAPLDPGGTAYVIVQDECAPDIDKKSSVPYR